MHVPCPIARDTFLPIHVSDSTTSRGGASEPHVSLHSHSPSPSWSSARLLRPSFSLCCLLTAVCPTRSPPGCEIIFRRAPRRFACSLCELVSSYQPICESFAHVACLTVTCAILLFGTHRSPRVRACCLRDSFDFECERACNTFYRASCGQRTIRDRGDGSGELGSA